MGEMREREKDQCYGIRVEREREVGVIRGRGHDELGERNLKRSTWLGVRGVKKGQGLCIV